MAASLDEDAGTIHKDLLNENDGAVIENPLAHLNEEQLLRDVDTFATTMGLTDIRSGLRNAALVAQNATLYDEVARGNRDDTHLPVKLKPEEKIALRNERDHLFAQSTGLYMTILTVSIAGILQGWVQSSINGATIFFPAAFGLDVTKSHDQWIIGVTNAAPFLFATLLGCPLVDPVNRRFGRKGAILVAAVLIFASSLGSAFAKNWGQLFACRVFNGIGMGLKASSTPILASETAVSFWRGTAALCWQLWVAFGIALGFAANLIVNTAKSDTSMRLQLGAPMVPALILMISLFWCPESPRWHMIKGDPESYRKAYNLFLALRNTPIQAQRDLYLIHKQIQLETYTQHSYDIEAGPHGQSKSVSYLLLAPLTRYASRFTSLFSPSQSRLRNALLAACTVNLAQQLCGINVLAFYSNTLFSGATGSSNSSDDRAFLYSLGFGLINFTFCIPAIRSIDTLGRRALLLSTLPFMSLCLFGAAFSFYIPADKTAHIGLIAFFLFVFAALYSPGLGPMPFTVASEAFPLSHREVGVAVSVGLNLFFAGLLTLFYPRINAALNDTGSLCLFAALNLVAAGLIFMFLPETKQRSLEELDLVFAVPVRRFVAYQVREVIPWVVGRYLLGRDVRLRDFYQDSINNSEKNVDGPGEMQQGEGNRVGETVDLGRARTSGRKRQNDEVWGGPREPQRDHEVREVSPHQVVERSHLDILRERERDTVSIGSSVGTHD